jgi:hypothetical protein
MRWMISWVGESPDPTCILLFCVAKLRKKDKIDIIPRQAVKVDAEGESLNNCSGVK